MSKREEREDEMLRVCRTATIQLCQGYLRQEADRCRALGLGGQGWPDELERLAAKLPDGLFEEEVRVELRTRRGA